MKETSERVCVWWILHKHFFFFHCFRFPRHGFDDARVCTCISVHISVSLIRKHCTLITKTPGMKILVVSQSFDWSRIACDEEGIALDGRQKWEGYWKGYHLWWTRHRASFSLLFIHRFPFWLWFWWHKICIYSCLPKASVWEFVWTCSIGWLSQSTLLHPSALPYRWRLGKWWLTEFICSHVSI